MQENSRFSDFPGEEENGGEEENDPSPLMKLPTILAGPIVRRSTPERVHIWLATSVSLASDSTYVKMFDHSKGFKRIAVKSEITSVWLGLQLYVHIITVTPEENAEAELPVNVPILYDVILNNQGLTDLPGLDNLTLPDFILPSFVLDDPAVLQVHALYASCRKLHGPPPDMMPAVAKALKGAANRRPRYLFLTGDQIYADDVDGNILRYVHNLGIRVFGGAERIPGLPYALGPESNRGRYLDWFVHAKQKPVFTSGHKDFHLLTFGDYAAMYLLAWNDEVWGLDLPPGIAKKLRPFLDARFARRALANVVTYMIFDDHEITDDWFRTPEWRERALSNQSARRIIMNGLVAYWAFQGWGNDPSGFSENFCQLMSDFTLKREREKEAQDALLEAGRWSYLAPTPIPTLFLDTRTGRAGKNPAVVDGVLFKLDLNPLADAPPRVMRNPEAPRLLGQQEREQLSKLLAENAMKSGPLIIIAPSPIFGFRPIEEMQVIIGKIDPAFADLETWAANPRNVLDFMALIFNRHPRLLVVLSGDVHYASEIAVSIARPGSPTIPIAQFCSSAIKNHPMGLELWLAEFIRKARRLIEIPIAWWDFRKDDDGGITRYIAENESYLFKKLVIDHGYPNFVVQEKLWERQVGERILLENNVGELIVDNHTVRHRFWRKSNREFAADEFLEWLTSKWPVIAKLP